MLICSGWRTYRFLPTFWREFFPRYDRPMHAWQPLAKLASEHFGEQFDVKRGIVRFSKPACLRAEFRAVAEQRKMGPHVRYFEMCNPGHSQGDELVCLTCISDDNLTAAGHRMCDNVAAARTACYAASIG